MSTKIYDAYRLSAGSNVPLATRAVSAAVEPVYRKLAAEAVGLAAVILYGQMAAGLSREQAVEKTIRVLGGFADCTVAEVNAVLRPRTVERVSPLTLAAGVVRAINKAARTRRVGTRSDLLFEVSWMVDPEPNPDGSHDQYAKLYTVRDEYRQAFLAATGAADFHYQNSTDGPDDVTQGEWETRREVWDRVLGDAAPAEFCPSWSNPWVNRLEFATWMGDWLNHAAVLDALDGLGVLQPLGRAKLAGWFEHGDSPEPCTVDTHLAEELSW